MKRKRPYCIYKKWFYLDIGPQSNNFTLFPFKIKRRDGTYCYTGAFKYRRSKIKGIKYIDIHLCHFVYISIKLSKPI